MSTYLKRLAATLILALGIAQVCERQITAQSPQDSPTPPPLLKAPFSPTEAKQAKASWSQFLAKDVSYRVAKGPEMTLIPPGEFFMGLNQTPFEICDDFPSESPKQFIPSTHGKRVSISKPFFLGKHEITVNQFSRFVNATGYVTEREKNRSLGTPLPVEDGEKKASWKNTLFKLGGKAPVTFVSWNDANAYCDWLSTMEGKKYRLPTQAEWEYACRAGTETRYSSGHDVESLVTVANVPNLERKNWNRIDIGYGEQRLSMVYPGKPRHISIRQDESNASTYFLVDSEENPQGKTTVSNDTEMSDLFIISKNGDTNIDPSVRVLAQPAKISQPVFLSGRWYEGTEDYPLNSFSSDILPGMEFRLFQIGGNWEQSIPDGASAMCVTELLGTDKVRLINQDLSSALKYRVGNNDLVLKPQSYADVVFVRDNTARTFSSDGYQGLATVGQFKPNAFGLHDMHGNVWEWCADGFDLDYQKCDSIDPVGSLVSDKYAIRGACFL